MVVDGTDGGRGGMVADMGILMEEKASGSLKLLRDMVIYKT